MRAFLNAWSILPCMPLLSRDGERVATVSRPTSRMAAKDETMAAKKDKKARRLARKRKVQRRTPSSGQQILLQRVRASQQEHSVILTAQRDSFYNRGKLNYHPIGKDSRWAVQRLSRYPRCAQAPSGRGCAMNSTLALTSGSIGWRSSCPIPKRA